MAGRSFSRTYNLAGNFGNFMTIEYLDGDNLEEALDFAEMSHANSAWQDYPFERGILRDNLIKMIGRSKYFTCLYRKNGEIIGYWFATLCVLLCSSKLRGEENGIYISPAHRGGRAAVLMYAEFKRWCDLNGAEPIASVQFSDGESNQKAYSFFKRLGMIECGRIFRGGNYGVR
jgi:GNAT superfamily N-acetyltransferase